METDVQSEASPPAAPAQRARADLNALRPCVGRVEVVRDRAGFAALQAGWDALVERCDDQIFYRHAFFQIWLDNFAPGAALRILTLRADDGRLTAALPLVWRRTRLCGLPVRELGAAANAHSCRFDLLAEDPAAAADAFLARLQADVDWDVLRLSDVPEGGRAHALTAWARTRGLPTGTWRSLASPYVTLPASWEALQQAVDGKFRANLRRRRKRLEEKGAVTLEQVRGGLSLQRLLDEGMRLEASGWKGRGGTAMAQDLATRGFYTELARVGAQQGKLSLWFLRLDGRAAAFHYALEHQGRYLLLKPGYDEAIRECSPGQLLMEEVLRDCVARGLGEFDFLGPDMPWKRDWTGRVRGHDWLFIFRAGVFGRALRGLKFSVGPRAREMVSQWKR